MATNGPNLFAQFLQGYQQGAIQKQQANMQKAQGLMQLAQQHAKLRDETTSPEIRAVSGNMAMDAMNEATKLMGSHDGLFKTIYGMFSKAKKSAGAEHMDPLSMIGGGTAGHGASDAQSTADTSGSPTPPSLTGSLSGTGPGLSTTAQNSAPSLTGDLRGSGPGLNIPIQPNNPPTSVQGTDNSMGDISRFKFSPNGTAAPAAGSQGGIETPPSSISPVPAAVSAASRVTPDGVTARPELVGPSLGGPTALASDGKIFGGASLPGGIGQQTMGPPKPSFAVPPTPTNPAGAAAAASPAQAKGQGLEVVNTSYGPDYRLNGQPISLATFNKMSVDFAVADHEAELRKQYGAFESGLRSEEYKKQLEAQVTSRYDAGNQYLKDCAKLGIEPDQMVHQQIVTGVQMTPHLENIRKVGADGKPRIEVTDVLHGNRILSTYDAVPTAVESAIMGLMAPDKNGKARTYNEAVDAYRSDTNLHRQEEITSLQLSIQQKRQAMENSSQIQDLRKAKFDESKIQRAVSMANYKANEAAPIDTSNIVTGLKTRSPQRQQEYDAIRTETLRYILGPDFVKAQAVHGMNLEGVITASTAGADQKAANTLADIKAREDRLKKAGVGQEGTAAYDPDK